MINSKTKSSITLENLLYQPDLLPLIIPDKGPLTEKNLLLSDYYIHKFRYSKERINHDVNKLNQTLTNIFEESDNELLKIRSILIILMLKNIIRVTPTFEFLINENLGIRYYDDYSDENILFNENLFFNENRYFNDIFFNQLRDHPILILDLIEIIRSSTYRSLDYEQIYPIINQIILINEDTMTPVHPKQLIFMEEKNLNESLIQKIKETYPIILPFNIKYREYCQNNVVGPTINIKVNRDQVLNAIWSIFDDFKVVNAKLNISFLNEPDSKSGTTKEFIDLAFTEIMKGKTNLFDLRNGFYWFKYHRVITEDLKKKYKCVGMLLGIAILNNLTIPVHFPRYFYKKLLNREICITDLAIFYPQYFEQILVLLQDFITPEHSLDFTYIDALNEYEIDLSDFSLVEDSQSFEPLPLLQENKVDFVNRIAEWVFDKSVKDAFDAFVDGYKKINKNELKNFRLDEIDKIVSGELEINWNALKENAVYLNGLSPGSQNVRWFWEYFDEIDELQKFEIFRFINGSSLVPIGGIEKTVFKFYKSNLDYIKAWTCFARLDLPEYKSYDELKEKFNEAILII